MLQLRFCTSESPLLVGKLGKPGLAGNTLMLPRLQVDKIDVSSDQENPDTIDQNLIFRQSNMFLWIIFANSLPVITADDTDHVASYKGDGPREALQNPNT